MASKQDILRQYGQYSVELAQRLKDGVKLNLEEQMFVENHLLIVQLALALSKQSKTKAPVPVRGE